MNLEKGENSVAMAKVHAGKGVGARPPPDKTWLLDPEVVQKYHH